MDHRRVLAVSVLLLALVALGGCAAPSTQNQAEESAGAGGTTETADLAGTSWECYEFAVASSPQTVLSSAPITAVFGSDGKVTGSAGVNSYSTAYSAEGEFIEIDDAMAVTKMAGPEDAMKQETDYLTTLPTAQSYKFVKGDLVLFGPAQNMIARYHSAK